MAWKDIQNMVLKVEGKNEIIKEYIYYDPIFKK